MTATNFNSIDEIIKTFPTEESCLKHLEKLRWNGMVISPFDPISKVYKCQSNYRCRNSGKYFNAKTGSMFYNSKIELQKWFIAIWIVAKNQPDITSIELGKQLQITQKSAWYMLKRIKSHLKIETGKNKIQKSTTLNQQHTTLKVADMDVIIEDTKFQMSQWLKIFKS